LFEDVQSNDMFIGLVKGNDKDFQKLSLKTSPS